MSTGTKVALATAAGAAAITAVGLATSKAGRRMTKKVGRKVHDIVDAGKQSIKRNPMVREVVEAGIGTAIGAVLPRNGRSGSSTKQDTLMQHVDAASSPASRSRGQSTRRAGSSRGGARKRKSGRARGR